MPFSFLRVSKQLTHSCLPSCQRLCPRDPDRPGPHSRTGWCPSEPASPTCWSSLLGAVWHLGGGDRKLQPGRLPGPLRRVGLGCMRHTVPWLGQWAQVPLILDCPRQALNLNSQGDGGGRSDCVSEWGVLTACARAAGMEPFPSPSKSILSVKCMHSPWVGEQAVSVAGQQDRGEGRECWGHRQPLPCLPKSPSPTSGSLQPSHLQQWPPSSPSVAASPAAPRTWPPCPLSSRLPCRCGPIRSWKDHPDCHASWPQAATGSPSSQLFFQAPEGGPQLSWPHLGLGATTCSTPTGLRQTSRRLLLWAALLKSAQGT